MEIKSHGKVDSKLGIGREIQGYSQIDKSSDCKDSKKYRLTRKK